MEFLILIGIAIIIWLIYRHYKKITTIHIDDRGYERDGYDNLIHRRVAYKHIYSYPRYPKRFSDYDVHHIDKNKLNNHQSNLKILTRDEHKATHGF